MRKNQKIAPAFSRNNVIEFPVRQHSAQLPVQEYSILDINEHLTGGDAGIVCFHVSGEFSYGADKDIIIVNPKMVPKNDDLIFGETPGGYFVEKKKDLGAKSYKIFGVVIAIIHDLRHPKHFYS